MNNKYKHIFFDLDRTLWDYDFNSKEALLEIFENFDLKTKFENFELFHQTFEKYNDQLWADFREGRIVKKELRTIRFDLTLKQFGTDNWELAETLNTNFLDLSPRKEKLIAGTIELLDYLTSKKYNLYIITNGFYRIQKMKIESSGIEHYFRKMFTSDSVKAHKPHREIFARSITWANARKCDCLMVGDDLPVDIIGARNYGIDQVYLNPLKTLHSEKVTYEISGLEEMMEIL